MKLKKLTLQGYKTFATKTEFEFDDGLTAIVGPNGSGKSNIADALRWVLGEQSYSTLRGKRTVDMIFAGSQTRPRAGMAQAILKLDNSDNWLPIDYSEVEIGRRAYRSGDNEYTINGQKVRLKDISDLLARSGLSERTYTIIGQGLIDRALSLRADERRALFEEAAGINHYKNRRAETLRRLNETQHNLERVHDILAEIRPRLNSLKRQATRALNYEQIHQDLRQLLRIWYGYKWDQSRSDLRSARKTAEITEKTWQDSRHALLVHQKNLDDAQREINRLQVRQNEVLKSRDEIREKLDQVQRDAAIFHERRLAIGRQLDEIELELPVLEQQRLSAQLQLTQATDDLLHAQTQLNEDKEKLRLFKETNRDQAEEIKKWQELLEKSERGKNTAQTGLFQAEGQLSQLRERLNESEGKNDAGELEEFARLEAEVTQQTAVLNSEQENVQSIRQKRDELQEQRQKTIEHLKSLRRESKKTEIDLAQQQNKVARLEARVDLLDQLRHKEIAISGDVDLIGTLAGQIEIDSAYKDALEAALTSRLSTLIVGDEFNLWKIVENQEGQQINIVSLDALYPPRQPSVPDSPGVLGWANNFVSCPKNLQPIVNLLFGQILIVQERDIAFSLAPTLPPGALAITPDGFITSAGGLVTVGSTHQADGVLSREADWQEAIAALEIAKQEVIAREEFSSKNQESIQLLQDRADNMQSEDRRLSRLENESLQRVSLAQRRGDRIRQQQGFIKRQKEQQVVEVQRLKERISILEKQILQEKETVASFSSQASEAASQLKNLPILESQQQLEGLQQRVYSAETIVAGRQAVLDSRRTTLNQTEQRLERLNRQKQSLSLQLESTSEQDNTSLQQQLNEQKESLDARIKPLQERLLEGQESIASLQIKTSPLQNQAHEAETRYTQTQIRLTQQESFIETLQERIHTDLGLVTLRYDKDQTGPNPLPMNDVVEYLPQVSELPEDIEENIHQFRGQLQRMGGINPDAPAEFDETQERYDFLTQQIEDLNQTEQQLRQVINELDELTSRAFAETVDRVNLVFGQTFTQLFGGGSARLVLTDPDDLTISGVDIVARLPNRREQGLGLLSGGERSLTASALIFSLLKVSPTPFCVLDEVDAALDEANINRFREILRELSLKTQFIIITHNRGTVQAAQTIYGVSMQPDSASQVISIRPEEYTRQELV